MKRISKITSVFHKSVPIRIILPSIVTYILFGAVFIYIILPSLEKTVMAHKRETIHEMTKFAWNIVAQHERDAASGEMTLEEAKSSAIKMLENIRYGKDNLDYFWINDERPYFVMHPFRKDLIGKEISSLPDQYIKEALIKIHEFVGLYDEGFLEYVWQWQNNPSEIGPKISYVKKFAPWGWTVGTGMYLEDVKQEIELLKTRFRFSASIIFLFTGAMLAFIIYQNIIDENIKKTAQKELLVSQRKYRDLVQSVNSAILRVDKTGTITFFNKFSERFFGFSQDEIIGKNVVGTIIPISESYERYLEKFLKDISNNPEKYSLNEIENICKNGDRVWIAWTIKAVYDDTGELAELLCIGNDITELKSALLREQQQQQQLIQADKMASLGILVSGVAHEINNPNQLIMGNTSVLKNIYENCKSILKNYHQEHGEFEVSGFTYQELLTQVPEMFSDILSGSSRIKHIVQELRDFALFRPDERIELVDFNAVVQSAVTLTSNMIKKSTGDFSITLGSELPLITGNFQQLEQVIINLIQNACQSLPDVSKSITLTIDYDTENECIICVLNDQGIGMDADVLKHVTDPFFTTKRDIGSTGLGLSISSKIISEHGGEMSFESFPGKGTTVTLNLPVQIKQDYDGKDINNNENNSMLNNPQDDKS